MTIVQWFRSRSDLVSEKDLLKKRLEESEKDNKEILRCLTFMKEKLCNMTQGH